MASCVHQNGSNASETPLRSGSGTIATNTQSFAVVDASITANSIVVVNLGLDNGALATQTGMSVCLNPGTGFTVRISAVATNPGTGCLFSYAVLRY
jgi:hypothetical protein